MIIGLSKNSNKYKSMKKIAFLIPSMSSGGMERVMSQIVTYFSKNKNLECHLLIYGKSDELEFDFYPIPTNVFTYRPSFKFNNSFRFWYTIKTALFIRNKIKEIAPFSILSYGEYWNNLVLLSLLGTKSSIFVSDRSSPEKSLGKIHEFLRSRLYPNASGVILQTKKAEEILSLKYNNKNTTVIGNPIRTIDNNLEIKRENIVLTIGRLISTKNLDRLIEIFYRINNKEWKLIIVGGDSNKEKNSAILENQIASLGMSENIILVGRQNNVDEYYLKSKIFAFTSSSEGFPNVIGEALSSGIPVISYNCIAGPSDMIEDGKNGFLISMFDDIDYEKKLSYLMNNETERYQMGICAKESIAKFSVENICNKYYNFILN